MIDKILYTGISILKVYAMSSKIKKDAIKASFDENDTVEKPIYPVSIMIPSYNEETLIEYALKSLKEQNVVEQYPEYFEFVLVDSGSTDNTVNIARNYVDKIVTTPRGKLTARNLSLPYLNGTLIVSVDSDTYYPFNWLNLMLKSLKYNKRSVGVSGFTIDNLPQFPKFINELHPIVQYIENMSISKNRLYGRCSVYYKDLHVINLFNESINQFNVHQMVREEENGFGNKLSKYGYVLFNRKAACLHLGNMKYGCRSSLYKPKDDIDKLYCQEIKDGKRF